MDVPHFAETQSSKEEDMEGIRKRMRGKSRRNSRGPLSLENVSV
jgi:hypothetical protein